MMLRFLLRLVVLAIVLGVVAAFFFGYRWDGTRAADGESATGATGSIIDADRAKRAGAEIADRVAAGAAAGATRAEKALAETRLTAKIKSKMALDDTIDSSRIEVDTTGTVVTVVGSVATKAQRERVLQLARETAGVTSVVDQVKVR
jgi:hyperosmotically inducible protein